MWQHPFDVLQFAVSSEHIGDGLPTIASVSKALQISKSCISTCPMRMGTVAESITTSYTLRHLITGEMPCIPIPVLSFVPVWPICDEDLYTPIAPRGKHDSPSLVIL